MGLQQYFCENCNKEYWKRSSLIKGKHHFCSMECKGIWQKTHFKKRNNPNFGKKWDKERRKAISEIVKEKMKDESIRWKAGSANRGKKFSRERIERMHGHRNRNSYSHPKSNETRKKIGIASKNKFTPEYRVRIKKEMEERGWWKKDCQRTDIEIYYKESNWIERMFDQIQTTEEKKLLEEFGVFNAFTNQKGVVRDHLYPRKDGFKDGVFPEIMRHPCNCKIITHGENVKKCFKKGNAKSITKEELFNLIESFNGDWKEQPLTLLRIKEYKEGKRWINEF